MKKLFFTGYGGPAGVPNGQLAKAANTGKYSCTCTSFVSCRYVLSGFTLKFGFISGYGMMPNGKGTKGAGASNGKGLKGGVLSPEQPSATPEEVVAPQQATTQGAAPVAPEPTSGILVMVTQEKYQKLPSPVTQEKSYKQTPLIPQAMPEPAPAIPQGKTPMPAPESTPEPAPMGPKAATSGPVPVVHQTNPAPEPAAVLPQGKYPKPESAQCFCSREKHQWLHSLWNHWFHYLN